MTDTFLGKNPFINEDQQACIELLEEALEQARDGKIFALAMVVCMEGGFADVIAGRRAGDLYMGCGDLQSKILEAVKNQKAIAQAKAKKSSILRVK